MLEKDIEKTLKKHVEERGGITLKLEPPGTSGLPDRLVIWPGGRIDFVELKRGPEEKTRPLQDYWIARLRDLDCRVFVLSSVEDVKSYVWLVETWAAPKGR